MQLDQRGRALGFPAVLVVAHPLHAHGAADGAREQHGVGGGVLVAVPAVAAGAVEVLHADAVGRQGEHDGQLAAQPVCRLRG